MMKRNVYLIILTIITILCVIAGTGYHLVRFGISVAEGLPSIQTFMDAVSDWDDDASADNAASSSSAKNTKTVSSSQNLDAFTSIQADMSVIDLNVVSGDSYSIQYKANQKFVPEFEVKNNCLTIRQRQKVSVFPKRNIKCTVTVTVADSLDSVKIQSDAGMVTLSDQTITTLSLYADAGDINLKNCAFGKSTLETDAGDFDLKNCTFTAFSLYADAGDINLENCALDKGTLETDAGDVDLKNCTFTNMDISSDAGDVAIDSKEDLSGYHIDLDASFGDVTVNHKNQRSRYSHDGTRSGHTLTVSTDAGDIDLNY